MTKENSQRYGMPFKQDELECFKTSMTGFVNCTSSKLIATKKKKKKKGKGKWCIQG